MFYFSLVNLNGRVDLPDEAVGGDEPDRAGHYGERDDHDGGVAKVEERGHKVGDLELVHEVKDGVEKDVDGAAGGDEQAPPPPVVVLKQKVKNDYTARVSTFFVDYGHETNSCESRGDLDWSFVQ